MKPRGKYNALYNTLKNIKGNQYHEDQPPVEGYVPELQVNLSNTVRKLKMQKQQQEDEYSHQQHQQQQQQQQQHYQQQQDQYGNVGRTPQHPQNNGNPDYQDQNVPEMTIYLEDILQSQEYLMIKESLNQVYDDYR